MNKFYLLPLIIIALAGFSSCTVNKELTTQQEFEKYYINRGNQPAIKKEILVLIVETKQGDTILFNKNFPGRIIDSGVFGQPQVHLKFNSIDSATFNSSTLEYIWKGGNKFSFIEQDSLGYLCILSNIVNVPLSDIQKVKIKDLNSKKKVAVTVGGILAVGFVIITIVALTTPINGGF